MKKNLLKEKLYKNNLAIEPLVQMKNIKKNFGGIPALDNVNFDVANEIHILVGHNGAGKSTLVKILMGAIQPDSGSIILNGKTVSFSSPFDAQKKCITMVWQELANFPNLTIAENIYMGHFPRMRGEIIDWKITNAEAEKFLTMINLHLDPQTKLSELTLPQQQLVEIAKALSFYPTILILDEPTSALSFYEQEIFYKTVLSLKAQGLSIIYVTHRINEIFKLGDRVTVLRDGKKMFTDKTKNLNQEIITEALIGNIDKNKQQKILVEKKGQKFVTMQPILELKNITIQRKIYNLSMTLSKGEILGIVGLSGSGISEIGKILFGVKSFDSGEIVIEGKRNICKNPQEAIRLGIGYVPKNRKEEGLIPRMSIADNIALPSLKSLSRGLFIDNKKYSKLVSDIIRYTGIKPKNQNLNVENFSGGNQQKIVLARWISKASKILILDEPTRGIDVGAKRNIYNLLKVLAFKGISIIILSSEFEEVHSEVDRLIVLSKGRIVGELDPQKKSWDYAFSLAIKG